MSEDDKKILMEITDVLKVLSDERRLKTMIYLFEKDDDKPIAIDEIVSFVDTPEEKIKEFKKEILTPLSQEALIRQTFTKNKDAETIDGYCISDFGRSFMLDLLGQFLPPYNDEIMPYHERLVRYNELMLKII